MDPRIRKGMVIDMTKKEAKELLANRNDDLKIVAWNWNLWKDEKIVSFVGFSKTAKTCIESMCYYFDDNDYPVYMPNSSWVKGF